MFAGNHNLGFTVPCANNGEGKSYVKDFVWHIHDGRGPDDVLSVIIVVTEEQKKDKAAKVSTARALWAPVISNEGGFGRWAFVEVANRWDAGKVIRAGLKRGMNAETLSPC